MQELNPLDIPKRQSCAIWALKTVEEAPTFRAKFCSAMTSKIEQPEEMQKLPLRPENTTVWCVLWAGGIIGPYFFKNNAGENVTINGDRNRFMITDYLMPEIEARDLGDIWFQQNGAPSHTSHRSMDLLRKYFREQIISRFGSVD